VPAGAGAAHQDHLTKGLPQFMIVETGENEALMHAARYAACRAEHSKTIDVYFPDIIERDHYMVCVLHRKYQRFPQFHLVVFNQPPVKRQDARIPDSAESELHFLHRLSWIIAGNC